MKRFFVAFIFILVCLKSEAHPGIGIVYDGNETIYYTDLNHVWKLNILTGKSEIYVKDVHTHELYLNNNGDLYGEHYWYIQAEEKFKNFIWKIDKKGKFKKVRGDQYGENNDFSFTRDKSFTSFEIREANKKYEIVKKDSSQQTVLYEIKLNHPTWKYLTGNETLLFIDFPTVYSYSVNSISINVIANDISSKRFPFSTQSDEHNIYGVWTDKKENIYAAIYGGRVVKKIDDKGNVARVFKSDFLWSPVNGVFDKNNNLWLMECKIGGKIRVSKISPTEIQYKATFAFENGIFISAVIVLITFFYLKIKRNRVKINK